jgi:hypothetical protein
LRGAINNPLKGFRDYHSDGYGLLHRQYIGWNAIELSSEDTVERISARTNEITRLGGKSFGELNIKLVPRVYLDWDGTLGTAKHSKQHWPADMAEFDYDSPAFRERLERLIAKLGQAWDNDPRIFAIEGEVEYNWQKDRKDADPEGTFGRTPDETMTVPAYRRYMIDKIRRYHATYLGWISWPANPEHSSHKSKPKKPRDRPGP